MGIEVLVGYFDKSAESAGGRFRIQADSLVIDRPGVTGVLGRTRLGAGPARSESPWIGDFAGPEILGPIGVLQVPGGIDAQARLCLGSGCIDKESRIRDGKPSRFIA